MGTAVVTGASSGLGRELALLLAARGESVVAVARSAEALGVLAAASPRITAVTADLSTPEGRDALVGAVGDVDVLVNNAGLGALGRFAELPVEVTDQMVEVNVAALTELTARWLPGMVARGSGRILNVASTAAFQPGPNMAVYFATKSYVLSLSEALAEELRGSGVTVTVFCPGAFESGFQRVAGMENSRLVKGRTLPSSEQMARAALRAMDRGAVVAVPGVFNRLGAFAPRLAPRTLVRRVAQWVQSEA
jgi:short-subunit dehydrogenase